MIGRGIFVLFAAFVVAWPAGRAEQNPPGAGEGFIVQRDSEVARQEPGPHKGKGLSTGYVFFEKAPDLKFSFRKRVLHPGASIGYHRQTEDEVYYVIGGQGKMTINGTGFDARPGDAFLTRTGSSHGIEQVGATDLTIVITFSR